MAFEIKNLNGTWVDIEPYIMFQGLDYQLSDVDAPDTGRTLDGLMHRGKITDKDKWKIKFRLLTTSEVSTVISLVSREFVEVRYLSPRYNSTVIKVMYVGDRTGSHCIMRDNGTRLWKDLSFSLIER